MYNNRKCAAHKEEKDEHGNIKHVFKYGTDGKPITKVATTTGFLWFGQTSGDIIINGESYLAGYVDFCSKHEYDSYIFPIKKGDTYALSGAHSGAKAYIIPCE